jgi:hypothetical protein
MDAALGSFASFFGYWIFLGILVIWMVVKIARGSGLMAVLTFFFWPLALVSLVRNWGNPDTDIRIPFFAAVATLLMMVVMAERTRDNLIAAGAPMLSDIELAEIAETDPEVVQQIMDARARLSSDDSWSGSVEGYASEQSTVASRAAERTSDLSDPSARSNTGRARESSAPAPPLDPAVDLAQSAAALSYYYGEIDLAAAHSKLQLPARWRMVMANRLHRMARLHGLSLEPGTLGWISHEDVDLGRASGWAVELRFLPVGYLPLAAADEDLDTVLAGLAGAALPDGSGRSFGSAAFAPSWDPATGTLSWFLDDATGLGEHLAARPLRDGVLLLVVRRLAPERREAALRATRLLSASVQVAPEWTHARGAAAPAAQSTSLLDWMQGTRLEIPAKPAATP